MSALFSMTGYGRGTATRASVTATVEVRTVNGRFLEIRPRVPRQVMFLEQKLREWVNARVKRGMVDVVLTLNFSDGEHATPVDFAVVKEYARAAKKLAVDLQMEDGLTAMDLLRLPGAFATESPLGPEQAVVVEEAVKEAAGQALAGLLSMREKEGLHLVSALERELSVIDEQLNQISKARTDVNKNYRERILTRISDVKKDTHLQLDQTRLEQEVLFYIDRSDVTEEMDRLVSHVQQCKVALKGHADQGVGKRLEFLVQEMLREFNTIGSKSDLLSVTKSVVEAKLTLEKMREQVQNLE